MKINIKAAVTVAAVAAAAALGIFAFCSFQGKYWFRSEPKLNKAVINLEKKPLKSRVWLTTQPCRDKLTSEAQVKIYDKIASYAAEADRDEFDLGDAGKDDFEIALNAFAVDHPEVFWIDLESSYTIYEYEDKLCASLHYTTSGKELENQKAKLDEGVEKAAKNAPDDATDYDIELYLNDFLSENCAYKTDADSKHTAYGALAGGKAVCDGYSHAFQLLCRRLGVECTVIEGTSDFNNDAENGHMWNCIQLGGDWYHIDVTWNDSTDSSCGVEHYFYVNLTEEQILRDHKISGGYSRRDSGKTGFFNVFVPKCDSSDLNYFSLNFVTIKDPSDDDQILASLIDSAKNKSDFCAYVIDESVDFNKTVKSITDKYADSWIQGANHYTGGNQKISDDGKVIFYENKRILAIVLNYE